MKTKIDKGLLLKKFHTICTASGIKPEEKAAMIEAYGVESSKDLTASQLSELIDALNKEPEAWRKRVIASIGAWLRTINKPENMDNIKGIACRAAGCEKFNYIPVPRLRDIYYEFKRKAQTAAKVDMVTSEEINYLQNVN